MPHLPVEHAEVAPTLLEPFVLHETLTLKNRIVMAPMTRVAADENSVPTEAMAAYYARRAGAGLIITESTDIRPDGLGYRHTPCIHNEAQIEGWRRVTERVHANGGKIFMQLRHVGRVTHPQILDGLVPVAPSAVLLEGSLPRAKALSYVLPRALTEDEIPELVAAFARAAAMAIQAGFDGVEIHGGNGYLIDQFLHYHTNRRKDLYGGSSAANACFALETVTAVSSAIGAKRVGLRLSPGASSTMTVTPGDTEVFLYLLERLSQMDLAYLHCGIFDDKQRFDHLQGTVSAFLRQYYRGVLIGNGSYNPKEAAEALQSQAFDLISLGRPFIANPDLITKVTQGTALTLYDAKMLETLI